MRKFQINVLDSEYGHVIAKTFIYAEHIETADALARSMFVGFDVNVSEVSKKIKIDLNW